MESLLRGSNTRLPVSPIFIQYCRQRHPDSPLFWDLYKLTSAFRSAIRDRRGRLVALWWAFLGYFAKRAFPVLNRCGMRVTHTLYLLFPPTYRPLKKKDPYVPWTWQWFLQRASFRSEK